MTHTRCMTARIMKPFLSRSPPHTPTGNQSGAWPRIRAWQDMWAWPQGSGTEEQGSSTYRVRRRTDSILYPSTQTWLQEQVSTCAHHLLHIGWNHLASFPGPRLGMRLRMGCLIPRPSYCSWWSRWFVGGLTNFATSFYTQFPGFRSGMSLSTSTGFSTSSIQRGLTPPSPSTCTPFPSLGLLGR